MQTFLFLAALCGAASATSPLLMEHLGHVPEGWHSVGVPEASRSLNFRIAMRQPNEALFEQTLLDISSPDHTRYGQHMKREELKDMLRPSAEATEAVKEWLEDAGVAGVEDDGEWMNFVATTSQAEELLDTQFAVYRHEMQNIGRCPFSVPNKAHG